MHSVTSHADIAITSCSPEPTRCCANYGKVVSRRLSYAGPGGVVVASMVPGSLADRAGLLRGDIIEEVNRRPVQTTKQVEEALLKARTLLRLHRQGGTFFLVYQK